MRNIAFTSKTEWSGSRRQKNINIPAGGLDFGFDFLYPSSDDVRYPAVLHCHCTLCPLLYLTVMLQISILNTAADTYYSALVLHTVVICFQECGEHYDSIMDLSVAHLWMFRLSGFCLFAVLMVIICRKLCEISGNMCSKPFSIGLKACPAVLFCFLISMLALRTDMEVQPFRRSHGDYFWYGWVALAITYDFLALLGIVYAGIAIFMALNRIPPLQQKVSDVYLDFSRLVST